MITLILIAASIVHRWMQFYKMMKDKTVENIHTSDLYFSAFIVPYNYYKIHQSETYYECVAWITMIVLILIRAYLTGAYIAKKTSSWDEFFLTVTLSSASVITYIIAGNLFSAISIWVMSIACMYGNYILVVQYLKIRRNKSSEGISSHSYVMAMGIYVLDVSYAIYYSNWIILPVGSIGFILCFLTYKECIKHKTG